MPLRLNVGWQKKVGQPNYGSLGASCHLDLELDHSLMERDTDALQRRIAEAFTTCRMAVDDELTRTMDDHASKKEDQSTDGGPPFRANGHRTVPCAANGRPMQRPRRPPTALQIRALHAIAARCGLDLEAELQQRFGTSRLDDLTRVETSLLIQDLNAATGGNSDCSPSDFAVQDRVGNRAR